MSESKRVGDIGAVKVEEIMISDPATLGRNDALDLADDIIRYQARIGDARDHATLAAIAGRLDLPGTQLWLASPGGLAGPWPQAADGLPPAPAAGGLWQADPQRPSLQWRPVDTRPATAGLGDISWQAPLPAPAQPVPPGAADPRLVWEWYGWRRGLVASCRPNPGHRALARWMLSRPGVTLERLEAALTAETDRIASGGVTEEEFARARNRLIAESIFSQDSQAAMARDTSLPIRAVMPQPARRRERSAPQRPEGRPREGAGRRGRRAGRR